MKITFLGTGTSQGIPVIGSTHPVCLSKDKKDKRFRASILIQKDDFQIVIDCGPDFRMQMLKAKVNHLDAILFTHEHADHTAGLDDIRQFSRRNGALPIFAHSRVIDNLKIRFDYIFNDAIIYKGKPEVVANTITNSIFKIKNQEILPIDMMHGDLQVFGYRIDNFAYLTDVSFIAAQEKNKLKNLDVLVVDALRIDPHPTHFNLQQALDLVEDLQPKQTYFTHISHKLGFHKEVQKKLPKQVFLSYDGLQISI
jgi:phosphoribosyl 1,2-cyclic phosphate phosphodiesterase